MKKLKIIVFNVEHGFCAFVKSPNGYTLLVDCGSTETFSPIKYIVENELHDTTRYNGYALTKFILTHPHDDHLTDIRRLETDLNPAMIFRQKYDWEEVKVDDEQEYEHLDSYAEFQERYNQDIIYPPDWGMNLYHREYLSPAQAKNGNEDAFVNNSSIPIFIEYNGYKIVFPGDLCKEGWMSLLEKENFKKMLKGTSFFVTSHHGHSSGYCKEIYECMGKPYFNIVSAHSRDMSVESAYSKPENATGVQHGGQTRYMFSTRSEGSILIEIPEQGNATFGFLQLEDNLREKSFYPFI